MNFKKVISFFLLIFFSFCVYSQNNIIFDAIQNIKKVVPQKNQINLLSDSLNNKIRIINSKKIKETSVISGKKNNWVISLNFGINEFRGDIRDEKSLILSNVSNTYKISIGKSVHEIFHIYTSFSFGNLEGIKKDYILSQTQSTSVYDPYSNYEGSGEKFTAFLYEGELFTSINLQKLVKNFYPTFTEKKRFDIFYNLGMGILSFSSMKRNVETNNYIYAFGYNDAEGKFEEALPLLERPKARYLSFGYCFNYLLSKKININIHWIGKIADTDFLDASMMNQQNDKYRSILLGLEYKL